MDQNDLGKELSQLTRVAFLAINQNVPDALSEEKILESISDIVLFIRTQDPEVHSELLKILGQDELLTDIFESASKFESLNVQRAVIVDFVAGNTSLGYAYHDLLATGDLPAATRLMEIARQDLQSLASNNAIDVLISRANSIDFMWGVYDRLKPAAVETLVGVLEEIVEDQNALLAFARNNKREETCDAFRTLVDATTNPGIQKRIDNALSAIDGQFKNLQHPSTEHQL